MTYTKMVFIYTCFFSFSRKHNFSFPSKPYCLRDRQLSSDLLKH